MTMNPEVKALWTTALESGEYLQGRNGLRREDTYCCLGVLCDLAAKAGIGEWARTRRGLGHWGFATTRDEADDGENMPDIVLEDGRRQDLYVLPPAVARWAGLDSPDPLLPDSVQEIRRLSALNDNGVPFDKIASKIAEGL